MGMPNQTTSISLATFHGIICKTGDIEKEMKELSASGKYSKPIATQVVPFTKFWEAEAYHQDYIEHNPNSGYVQYVSIPEIKEFQKQYPQLVKPDHVF